jgi:hypothetical protein
MTIKKLFSFLYICAFLVAPPLAMTACSNVDDDGDEVAALTPPPQNIDQAPPAMLMEMIPAIQDPQAEIWKPGYWALLNGRFEWIHGKVIPRPYPTAVWAPAHWVHHSYGWSFEMGHWE